MVNYSVGKGGYFDCDGDVMFDVSIMDGDGCCGVVVCIEYIVYLICVVWCVMEVMLYVLLVGDGVL